jgi:hypothetical protein
MHVNLIPRQRTQRLRRQARRRTWVTLCSVYAMFLAVASIVARVSGVSDDRVLRQEYELASARAAQEQQSVQGMRDELRQMGTMLRANRTVGDQPDWSVLLALLARACGEDVVLREVALGLPGDMRRAAAVDAPSPASDAALLVTVGGLGRSQQAVTQFVVRLEDCGLFRQVTLLDTRREPLLSSDAVAFRLECALDTREEPSP